MVLVNLMSVLHVISTKWGAENSTPYVTHQAGTHVFCYFTSLFKGTGRELIFAKCLLCKGTMLDTLGDDGSILSF